MEYQMLHLNDLGLLDIAKGREELVKFCLCGCGRDASNEDSKNVEGDQKVSH